MSVPERLRPWLRGLAKRGVLGTTEAEVADYLLTKALWELIGADTLRKLDETNWLLKEETDGKRRK